MQDPPDELPTPVLHAPGIEGAATNESQPGVLVMQHWWTGGRMVAREMERPIPWPAPLSITGNAVRIALGTRMPPVQVETRIFRAIDADGMPISPISWTWCRYHSAETGCQIVREGDDQQWSAVLELPVDADTVHISLRAAWGVPDAPAFAGVPEGTILDGGWLFTVTSQ